mmetsp:Transcript_9637/g.20542  ORF Transcript_9637/g.20542 Transcript_9637/m.20542 type:complete len:318 (-) Transcript_9637:2-955(-)
MADLNGKDTNGVLYTSRLSVLTRTGSGNLRPGYSAHSSNGNSARSPQSATSTSLRNPLHEALSPQPPTSAQSRTGPLLSTSQRRNALLRQSVPGGSRAFNSDGSLNANYLGRSSSSSIDQQQAGGSSGTVSALKEKLRSMMRERDKLAEELQCSMKKTRATRVAEMEVELEAYERELVRQKEMQRVMMERLAEAEKSTQEAVSHAKNSLDALLSYLQTKEVPKLVAKSMGGSRSLSASRAPRTLQALRQAHEVLQSQASLLRRLFPSTTARATSARNGGAGGSPTGPLETFIVSSEQSEDTAGAADVLRYILIHLCP